MDRPRRSGRILGLLPGLAMVLIGPGLRPMTGLGQGPAQAQAPAPAPAPARGKGADLLKSAPFDRITLIDSSVHEVDPLSPRPLPPLDPKKARTPAALDEMARRAAEKRGKARDPFVRKTDDAEEEMILIHMVQSEPRDFKVKRASIKEVEYFEDMLLAEADRLTVQGDFARAFERLLLVRSRDPSWRGLDDRVDRLLFEEGGATLASDNARGLRLLNDLHARKPDYPGLADRLAASFSKRIDRAVVAGDFRAGRQLLRELEQVAPGHPEARSVRGKLVARAKSLVDSAARTAPPDRVDRLAEAARIWPDLDGLEAAHAEAFRAEPTMAVAVADLAEPAGPFPRSPAASRVARLLYLPVMASDDEPSRLGQAPGQLLDGLEVVDLGKGLRIRLRPGPTWSDGSRPASAIDVARSLADRASPASPGYIARWADLLERVEALDEDRVEVRLARPTLKPESWLLDPVGPAHAGADGRVSSPDRGRRPVGDGPFSWESSGDGTTLLRSSAAKTPGIRRIREARIPDPAVAVQALLRGDVVLLERVPPDRVAELGKVDGIRVGRFATPSVHRIAIDGRSPALRNRNLRRALSLAVDRKGLLEDFVLRRPSGEVDRVADGPAARGSFVDAPDVEPFEYNPLLAKGLVNASKKEMGGNPIALTLEFPAIAEARAVCPRIAEAFKLIGVEVELIERPESELESGLRSGRRFDLAYRASRPSRPLLDLGPALVPGYDAPSEADALASAASPRILQLLIDLDRAPETTSARTLAVQVDREARDELPVLPLWQLEDHYAWRAQLRGPAESAEHLYQGAEAWEIDPWFARDPG